MTNGPPTDLTAFEGPDDWVSLYLDGVGDDLCTDAEVCMLIRCLFCCPYYCLDCVVLDLQLSDLPVEDPDPTSGTVSAAESTVPVTISDRCVAKSTSSCEAV